MHVEFIVIGNRWRNVETERIHGIVSTDGADGLVRVSTAQA